MCDSPGRSFPNSNPRSSSETARWQLLTLCLPRKQVLDTPEPLRNLADLIAAQLEFHKKAYEILSELAPVVDGLQVEQEVRHEDSLLLFLKSRFQNYVPFPVMHAN